jgi:autotransporter-associated beta strand protein
MKLKNTPLTSLICVSLLSSAALSQGGVLWSDNFNGYSNGGLRHQGGGGSGVFGSPGWGGNSWFGGDGGVNVTSGVVNGNGNARHGLTQTFAATVGASGTLWLSFDWGHDSANTTNTYGGITFFGANERALIGNTWNAATWNVTNANTNTAPSSIGIKTAVAKITLGAGAADDTIDLWVGPTDSPVDVSGPAMIRSTNLELGDVDQIRIMGNNPQTFDNLVIGEFMGDVDATVPPPPPASGTWASTNGGLWGTTTNWTGDVVATGSDSTASFNTLDLTADTTVNLDSAQTIGNLVFGDTDALSAAGWTLGNNGAPGNTLTLSGTAPTITVNALGDSKTTTISTAVAGSSGLTKAGPGTLALTAAVSYSGATTISQGTLLVSGQPYLNIGRTTTVQQGAVFELNNSNNNFNTLMPVSSIAGAGTFRLSGNSTINQVNNGTVSNRLTFAMAPGGLIDLQGTSQLTNGGWKQMNWTNNNASMNIASGATFDIWDGLAVNIDALTGSGTVNKGHPDPNTFTLTLGVANGSGTFSGTIQNTSTAGAVAITKIGTGTQTLSGTLSYNGNTTVQEGVLSIGNGNDPTTLSDTATVTIGFGAQMDLNFIGNDTVGVLDINGSGPLPAGSYNSSHEIYGEFFTGTGSLVIPVTATPYELWADSFIPAIGLPAEDDDNDGVTNFEEFAFGLAPDDGSSVNPISAPLDKANRTLSYTRRADSGLNYSVWFSTDLSNWLEDTNVAQGIPVPSGDNETVTITLSSLLSTPLPDKLFIQVRAD